MMREAHCVLSVDREIRTSRKLIQDATKSDLIDSKRIFYEYVSVSGQEWFKFVLCTLLFFTRDYVQEIRLDSLDWNRSEKKTEPTYTRLYEETSPSRR